jgi:RNA polymerase sigma-70 factor (ECF subfamily)
MKNILADQFDGIRRELAAYLCRLVVRPQIADELVQTTFLRCLEASDRLPDSIEGVRAWLFKVATNLAFDELRRHSTWRETMLLDLRVMTEANAALVEQSIALVGSPETKAIAREHLVACLACTLRNLPEYRAAALLLTEVHGFTVGETAELLDATPAQAKNWLQEARATMIKHYGTTCALLAKTGVCHQCVELDGFFASGQGNPLASNSSIDARLGIARESKERSWGPWHRMVFQLIDDMA